MERSDLNAPRFDQSTYWGRVKHFFNLTDPRNILATDSELEQAKRVVDDYIAGKEVNPHQSIKEIWYAKKLVDSAFHPDTGEKQIIYGRMSFQLPGNMIISGFMMTFYKSTPAVVFWQWVNQTFNCVVNYTNRNASTAISESQLAAAYVGACSASVLSAVGLNKIVSLKPAWSGGLIGRLVPFAAVAVANFVNLPLMRQVELKEGIQITSQDGQYVGDSKYAAKMAIGQVVPSRIFMAIPPMVFPPIVMNYLSNKPFLKRHSYMAAPVTVLTAGLFMTFSVPLCCALFPQKASLSVDDVEDDIKTKAKQMGLETLYYNKGL